MPGTLSAPSEGDQAILLSAAMKSQGLALVYQPKFSTTTGAACGVEVLARWPGAQPAKAWQTPDSFIRCAELQGLAPRLDRHILSSAMKDIQQWPAWLRQSLAPVSVNVSAASIESPAFLRSVKRLLSSSAPLPLIFELTETAPLVDTAQAQKAFGELAGYGVQLSLDDFGKGHNQPTRLELFNPRELKIDRRDTANLHNRAGRMHVQGLIEQARSAGLQVTAEGVECREQWQTLQSLGCDYGQGFWLAPPLPSSDMVAFIQQHSPEELKPTLNSPVYDPRQLWSGLAMRQHYG